MKISTIIKLIASVFTIAIVSVVLLILSFNTERKAVEKEAILKQAGLDLMNASDLLTNQARFYVQYGEKKYYDAYMYEIEVAKNRENSVETLKKYNASEEELALVEKAFALSSALAELETKAFEAASVGDLDHAQEYMFGPAYDENKKPITETMNEFQELLNANANKEASNARKNSTIMIILSLASLTVMFITITLSLTMISKKLKMVATLSENAKEIADGNVSLDVSINSKDEIGVLADSFKVMVNEIKMQAEFLECMATGDFSKNINLRSQNDTMNIAINKLIDTFNNTMSDIKTATEQVSSGAEQVAQGSQLLAQASTEQASSVEQLSNSIALVADITKENTTIADKASQLAVSINSNAKKGSEQMSNMTQAVKEIQDASLSINKVIKVIDDIAFQTNILALNAAVEAARAGQHGKGFAVVAEEVRSLAAKSAAAAKDTESLIANSIEKAQLGASISSETAISLSDIVTGINESSALITEIAKYSSNQLNSISEITVGIQQVSHVVQQNSATAQESAAASQEMNSQANLLDNLVSQFNLKGNNTNKNKAFSTNKKNIELSNNYLSDNSFGKY